MIDADLRIAPQPRRISVVVRALGPLQREMGALQERLAFLTATNLFAARNNQPAEIADALDRCSQHIVRMRGDLENVIQSLPTKSRSDTRLVYTRLALDRAEMAIAAFWSTDTIGVGIQSGASASDAAGGERITRPTATKVAAASAAS